MATHHLNPTRSPAPPDTCPREELTEMIRNVDKNCNGSVDLEVRGRWCARVRCEMEGGSERCCGVDKEVGGNMGCDVGGDMGWNEVLCRSSWR